MFEAEELIPRELVFLARTMRIAQGCNQSLGSPSNRIQLLAHWAAVGLDDQLATERRRFDLKTWLHDRRQILTFKFTLVIIDIGLCVQLL